MTEITIEHNVTPVKLDAMNVDCWPIWTKEVSTFEWRHESDEVCYILEGTATVTPTDGKAVTIQRGDLVRLPAGMSCTWQITEDIEKHYLLK